MEREYATWSTIEELVVKFIRECPVSHSIICFKFIYDEGNFGPSSFILETIELSSEAHQLIAEYLIKLIDKLEKNYIIVSEILH